MAIQVRRGLEANFDPNKMVPGEWAVSTDAKIVRMCFAPGIIKEIASAEEVKDAISKGLINIKEAEENALSNISDGLDKTLSVEGKAAESKATGEKISQLSSEIGDVKGTLSKVSNVFEGQYMAFAIRSDNVVFADENSKSIILDMNIGGKYHVVAKNNNRFMISLSNDLFDGVNNLLLGNTANIIVNDSTLSKFTFTNTNFKYAYIFISKDSDVEASIEVYENIKNIHEQLSNLNGNVEYTSNMWNGVFYNCYLRSDWNVLPLATGRTAIIEIENGDEYHIKAINNNRFGVALSNDFYTGSEFLADKGIVYDDTVHEYSFVNDGYKYAYIYIENNSTSASLCVYKKGVKDKSRYDRGGLYHNANIGLNDEYYECTISEDSTFTKNTTYDQFIAEFDSMIGTSVNVTKTIKGKSSNNKDVCLYDIKPVRPSYDWTAGADVRTIQTKLPKIIIVTGLHGFEKSNTYGLYYFVKDLLYNYTSNPVLEYLHNNVELLIVPALNTYGFDELTYTNANGVNLNRNYSINWIEATGEQNGGAEPFDQPETQIIRDIVLENLDAFYFIDSHTNGGGSVDNYFEVNWHQFYTSNDYVYNKALYACINYLAKLTYRFKEEFSLDLNTSDVCGSFNSAVGNGHAKSWVSEQGIIGQVMEGFNGFPNRAEYTNEVYKANAEIFGNWLYTICKVYI